MIYCYSVIRSAVNNTEMHFIVLKYIAVHSVTYDYIVSYCIFLHCLRLVHEGGCGQISIYLGKFPNNLFLFFIYIFLSFTPKFPFIQANLQMTLFQPFTTKLFYFC